MKRPSSPWIGWAIAWALVLACALFPTLAKAQEAPITGVTFASSGRPAAGVNVAICSTFTTTAASISNNLATFTFGAFSNPLNTGFTIGATLIVSGFTGGDTILNGSFAIAAVSASTISVAITHSNYSASTTGLVYQLGSSTQACAPLATVYTNYTGSATSTNPFVSDGLGNYTAWVASGYYVVQLYGPTVSTTVYTTAAVSPSGGSGTAVQYVGVGNYACSDVGINAAISALGTAGGTVDATACTSAGTIASTITLGANTGVSGNGVKLILPCTSSAWIVSPSVGGNHVFNIGTRSELQGCALRASLVFVSNTGTPSVLDVISFIKDPILGSAEYGKVSNVWIENDNASATITNGLLNLTNAYDSVIRDVKLAGRAPCLFYASDTSTNAPNSDDIENLLLDGEGLGTTQLMCIESNNGQSVGPLHFRGGDWSHPGSGKSSIVINRTGSGHTFGISISDLYLESNASDTTTAMISAADTSSLSLHNVWANRLSGSSTATCLSLSDSGSNQTGTLALMNFTCTGGTGSNALTSTVANIPSLAVSQIPLYVAPGFSGSNGYSSITGLLSLALGTTPPISCGTATGIFCATEGSQAGTPTASQDYIRADSVTHSFKCSENNSADGACLFWGSLPGSSACAYQSALSPVTGTGSAATYFTCTLPAGILLAGKGIRVTVVSKHTSGTGSVVYDLSFGGTTTTTTNPSGSANQVDRIVYEIFNTVGSTTAQEIVTTAQDSNAGTNSIKLDTAAINTASAVTITAQFNIANTDAITPEMFYIEMIQ